MNTSTSTRYSRRIFVEGRQFLREIRVIGDGAYTIREPRIFEGGVYRAELDPETRIATISQEATT